MKFIYNPYIRIYELSQFATYFIGSICSIHYVEYGHSIRNMLCLFVTLKWHLIEKTSNATFIYDFILIFVIWRFKNKIKFFKHNAKWNVYKNIWPLWSDRLPQYVTAVVQSPKINSDHSYHENKLVSNFTKLTNSSTPQSNRSICFP